MYYKMFKSDLYYKSTLTIKFPKKSYLYYKSIQIIDIFNCQPFKLSRLVCYREFNLAKQTFVINFIYQPGHIYYNLYYILCGTERPTISIKVGKIYYKMSNFELYYKSKQKIIFIL